LDGTEGGGELRDVGFKATEALEAVVEGGRGGVRGGGSSGRGGGGTSGGGEGRDGGSGGREGREGVGAHLAIEVIAQGAI